MNYQLLLECYASGSEMSEDELQMLEIAKFLTFIGGSRDPDAPTLFQSLNVDTGEMHCVHTEEVNGIVSSRKTL